jgi:stearoyl-CoA desaturase (delta-9 desaturase)
MGVTKLLNSWLKKINSDTKVKTLQASVYVTLLATLSFFWDPVLFFMGLGLGWFFWLAGINGSLHKYSSHKCFKARNKLLEIFILFMGTIVCLGSNISWAATHRKHHQFSDQEGDPHSIHTGGGGFWRAVKIYFYYFPTYLINPRTVKDLTNDPIHRWFHKHYYKVIFVYISALFVIGGINAVGYFWALPVFYVYTGISYITVFAHNRTLYRIVGYRNYNTKDHTFNWWLASILLPGEGNHNNHHSLPGAAQNSFSSRDIDLGLWYLKLIGRINNQEVYQKFVI